MTIDLDDALHDLPTRWPRLRRLIADVTWLRTEACQRAKALRTTAPVDPGPRSPSLGPGRGSSGHSDPVGDAVANAMAMHPPALTTGLHDALDTAHHHERRAATAADEQQARTHLAAAKSALLAAISAADRALTRSEKRRPKPKPATPDDPGCSSCRRIRRSDGKGPVFSETTRESGGRGGLCRKCREWREDQRELPPLGVLEAWRDGIRITPRLVAEAEARDRKRKAKAKHR